MTILMDLFHEPCPSGRSDSLISLLPRSPLPPFTQIRHPLHQAPDYRIAAAAVAEGASHLDRSPVQTAFQTRVSMGKIPNVLKGQRLESVPTCGLKSHLVDV